MTRWLLKSPNPRDSSCSAFTPHPDHPGHQRWQGALEVETSLLLQRAERAESDMAPWPHDHLKFTYRRLSWFSWQVKLQSNFMEQILKASGCMVKHAQAIQLHWPLRRQFTWPWEKNMRYYSVPCQHIPGQILQAFKWNMHDFEQVSDCCPPDTVDRSRATTNVHSHRKIKPMLTELRRAWGNLEADSGATSRGHPSVLTWYHDCCTWTNVLTVFIFPPSTFATRAERC